MRNKKIVKHIKPKDYDISFEYICPECGVNHWLTKIEANTKLFKIACDCGLVLIPERIVGLKLKYSNKRKNKLQKQQQQQENNTTTNGMSEELLVRASKQLESYGFEKLEAQELIRKAFDRTGSLNQLDLLRTALQSLGVNNATLVETD